MNYEECIYCRSRIKVNDAHFTLITRNENEEISGVLLFCSDLCLRNFNKDVEGEA